VTPSALVTGNRWYRCAAGGIDNSLDVAVTTTAGFTTTALSASSSSRSAWYFYTRSGVPSDPVPR